MAFRDRGWEAYSCDIEPCTGGHPEWHICQDVIPLINGDCEFDTVDGVHHVIDGKWDLLICHPPCTHLAVSGARHFEVKRKDGRQREAIEFFCQFLKADCDRIVVENPINIISGEYIKEHFSDLANEYSLPIKPNQIIHPWMFGDNYSKSTCLWEIGVPLLIPKIFERPELEWFEWTDKKTGKVKRQNKWYYDALKNSKTPFERAQIRSKTFEGIALAMAEQWGGYIENQ